MSRTFVRTLCISGLVGLGCTVGAAAQAPVQPQPKDPNMPAPRNTVPEKVEGRSGDATGSTGTLSDKLEKSDGVIKPPAEGAGRTITPPDTGTTPVIPPGTKAPGAAPK